MVPPELTSTARHGPPSPSSVSPLGRRSQPSSSFRRALVIPDDLSFVIDFRGAGGLAAVGVNDVSVGQDLKTDCEGRELIFPFELAVGGDYQKPAFPLFIRDQKNAVFDGNGRGACIGRAGFVPASARPAP